MSMKHDCQICKDHSGERDAITQITIAIITSTGLGNQRLKLCKICKTQVEVLSNESHLMTIVKKTSLIQEKK